MYQLQLPEMAADLQLVAFLGSGLAIVIGCCWLWQAGFAVMLGPWAEVFGDQHQDNFNGNHWHDNDSNTDDNDSDTNNDDKTTSTMSTMTTTMRHNSDDSEFHEDW
ncbi:hypothetical protein EDB85DRAFT_1889110 [Lactarius pseudohatsudake]|nr:hypothetical protein EDB85DRAFT_1889110 [Lactarius pseudohatsudake]